MQGHNHGDFETRSTVDIRRAGADVYAEHASTDVLTFSYALGDGPVRRWKPGDPNPTDLFDALGRGEKFVAHNAYFEFVIWNLVCVRRYGWPKLRPAQVVDTMAMAYAHALPGALADVAKIIRLDTGKDDAGRRVMLKLSQPRAWTNDVPIWYERADYPEMFAVLDAYCDQDVVVERAIEAKLPRIMPVEQRTWELDLVINRRGVPIDVVNARRALDVIEHEARLRNADLRRITAGVVPAATNPGKIVAWLRDAKGIEVHSLTKADVREVLARPDIDDETRRVLEIRQQVGKTSTKKLQAMLACTSSDGRARGLHQFHAASTGRWGGRRIQTQNMPRPEKGVDTDWVLDVLRFETGAAFSAIELVHGSATPPISSTLRSLIKAPEGRRFITADFSNVEGRVLPWLAGEDWKLEAFRAIDRGEGKDLYLVAASGIFGTNIDDKDDPRRQVGKVAELAMGYGGGAGAFANMAAVYNLDVPGILPFVLPRASADWLKAIKESWMERGRHRGDMTEDAWTAAEIVKMAWRMAHPMTRQFWHDIEWAAVEAMKQPGVITDAPRVRFRKAGSFLFMLLPSGRCVAYPFPKLVWRRMPWKDDEGRPVNKLALTYFCRIDESKKAKIVADKGNSGKWARVATYGGELTENADQAASRDLLRDAAFRAEAAGYPIVMHVHDELVTERPLGRGSLTELCAIMAEVPQWATGLPMAAAGWEGERYRK